MTAKDFGDRLLASLDAEVGESADDPRVAPRWILDGHPHNERLDLLGRSGSAGLPWTAGAVELLGDKATEPSQDRFGFDDRSDALEGLAAELVTQRGEPDPLGVAEPDPASDPEDTNLFIAP